MQPAPGLRPDIEQNSIERERPWLFNFLIAPMAVMSIAAVGLNLTLGYAGQASLAQGAFVGVGAYAAAIMTTHGTRR